MVMRMMTMMKRKIGRSWFVSLWIRPACKRLLSGDRGVALVAAVLVLSAVSVLATSFVLTSSMQKSTCTGSLSSVQALYYAQAGVEVGLQTVSNYARAKMDSLIAQWPGTGPIISSPQSFFPAGGLTTYVTQPCFGVRTIVSFADSVITSDSQVFNFNFESSSEGMAGFGRKSVVAEGVLRVSASRGTFADFLIFTDEQLTPEGWSIWFHTSGYFDGRLHTNGIYRFAYFPTFMDLVTSVDQKAWFYNRGRPKKLDSDHNGSRDVPNFHGGFLRGVDSEPLPQNAYSQQRVALGLSPTDTTSASYNEIRQALGLPQDGTPPPDGVYVVNDGSDVTGGIYVQGDAQEVSLSVDASGNQVIELRDSGGALTQVTVDRWSGATTVVTGAGTNVYNGLPNGMIYAEGQVQNVHGPGRVGDQPLPAIESNTQLSIVASDDIVITSDLTYEDFADGENVLGLFSTDGNIRIATSAPDELKIDGFVMASGDRKVFTVDNYWSGSYRGQVHLRGGVVQNRYGAFGTFSGSGSMTGYGRDFQYDRRGRVPPFFPALSKFFADQPVPRVLVWREA